MKNNWELKKLGDVCEIIGGGTPSKANSKFYNGEIPWATVRDMKYDLIEETEHKITREAVKSSSTNIIPKDNVIIATRVGLGKVCLLMNDTAINQDLRGIIPKNPAELSVGYLFRWLKSIAHIIEKEGTGATVQGVKLPFVKSLLIPIPSPPEQQRLVSILDETFAAIDKAKENAEKNLQNSRELFESTLQSVFSEKGEGWVEKNVEELVNEGFLFKPLDGNHGEIHPKRSDYVEAGVPFIMASDLKNGSVDFTGCKFISRNLADSLRTGFAQDGDILLSHKATIGRAAILKTDDDYVMLTPQVTYYRVKDENRLFNKFIYFYFLSPQFQYEILDYAGGGSTRAYIGITKQLKLSFLIPPIVEQCSIVAKLEALSAETQKLEEIYQQKLAALDELKKSVLQKAFNGKLTGA